MFVLGRSSCNCSCLQLRLLAAFTYATAGVPLRHLFEFRKIEVKRIFSTNTLLHVNMCNAHTPSTLYRTRCVCVCVSLLSNQLWRTTAVEAAHVHMCVNHSIVSVSINGVCTDLSAPSAIIDQLASC